ncbi:alkaline phosphatase [Jannaschia rubra]|uniref:alkaline phosphatase n=1 Tax=Jannaschia rubra TaxID=282197 RepID=UPI002492E69A|nr:alkaline phosphatase [Jannaschia rubra]
MSRFRIRLFAGASVLAFCAAAVAAQENAPATPTEQPGGTEGATPEGVPHTATTVEETAGQAAPVDAAEDGPAQQDARSADAWIASGQAALQERLERQPVTGRARNVILFVADGNSIGTNYATRIYQGQQAGGYGDENVLAKERMPYLALSKTYNTNAQTPDSAGTAVALNSGVKTKAGVIGVDETLRRGECGDVETARIDLFGEEVAGMGKSVGIVTTARLTHATPAAVYAHAADRGMEDDAALPEGCEVPDIAAQLLEKMKEGEVDLALGGGRRHFLPVDVEGEESDPGKRTDGRNLIEEAKEAGAQYAWNGETFADLTLDHSTPVLGIFESSHMLYEHDRADEPSLVEMTEAAIDYLSNNEDGYYLMVEGGRVDHANHDGNAFRAITDGVIFDEAVAKAMEMTADEDTLIIVTADHGHGLEFNGYCGRGSPITGLCHSVDDAGEEHSADLELGLDGKPYTAIGYMNGLGAVVTEQADGSYFGTRPVLTQEQAQDPDYLQQATLPLSSETHSPVDVAIYASGPWAHLFDGTVEQSYVYHVMKHAVEAE